MEIGNNVRKKVELAFLADKANKEELANIWRDQDQIKLASRQDGFENIIKPTYRYDERLKIQVEVDKPPTSLFMELGHDRTNGSGDKHYRKYYPDELEKIRDERGELLVESPFLTELIKRAKAVKSVGLLGALFGGGD